MQPGFMANIIPFLCGNNLGYIPDIGSIANPFVGFLSLKDIHSLCLNLDL